MLCARVSLPHSFSLFSPSPSFPLKPLFCHRRQPTLYRHRHLSHSISPTITMSSTHQVVEHIVLFKVKPDTDTTKVNDMITNLNGLTSMNLTLYLTAGPVLRSKCSSLSFTHMIHSRLKSKDDLATYNVHPTHLGVIKNFILPIIEDAMTIDWVSNELTGEIVPKAGSALKVSFLKLKEGTGEEEKARVMGVLGGIKDVFPSVDQVSVGENFSFERAKGYSIASIGVFSGLSDLEALVSNVEVVNAQKEKIWDLVDSVVVVDYVIPSPALADA